MSNAVMAQEWSTVATLWRRDMLRLWRERSRWFGVILQPLIFWLIMGSGMAQSFKAPESMGVDYLTYTFPGILVMIVLFTSIFATISVIEDRNSGFLQGVLVGPGSRASVVLGVVSGVTTLALVQTTLF
ncbi:MAG TPA: ABC transporter, partial [Myxococcales bacterium]|nr:ABC transporter [Myxococcales bacterium]